MPGNTTWPRILGAEGIPKEFGNGEESCGRRGGGDKGRTKEEEEEEGDGGEREMELGAKRR